MGVASAWLQIHSPFWDIFIRDSEGISYVTSYEAGLTNSPAVGRETIGHEIIMMLTTTKASLFD